jgi:hypothetical protein
MFDARNIREIVSIFLFFDISIKLNKNAIPKSYIRYTVRGLNWPCLAHPGINTRTCMFIDTGVSASILCKTRTHAPQERSAHFFVLVYGG